MAKIRLKLSKIAEKPANLLKIHINYQKPSNHYQNKRKNDTNHNQTFEPKN